MYIFSSVLLIVLAVFGAVFVVRELTFWVFSRKSESSVIIITPKTKEEDAELALRSALSKLRWSGNFEETTVMIDCEIDEKAKRILASVCREYGFKGLIERDEVIERLSAGKKCDK